MKQIIVFLLIVLIIGPLFAQTRVGSSFRTQSYYGFSGLMFLPSTQVTPPGDIGIGYTTKPGLGSELNLIPYSIRFNYGMRIPGLEVSATNTPFYASTRIYNGVSITQGVYDFEMVLPLFPSVKYLIMPMQSSNNQVAMSLGFALPYGAYYVVDKHIDVTLADLTIHSGVATKLTTYHVFAGVTTTFGRRMGNIQRGFNLDMLLELSWGGSLKQLDKKEESFIALTFRHAWTPALIITTFIRYDNQSLYDKGDFVAEGPVTFMGVGLDYHWQVR
jgi:hypothetical protein